MFGFACDETDGINAMPINSPTASRSASPRFRKANKV